jgi:hypothetical protein
MIHQRLDHLQNLVHQHPIKMIQQTLQIKMLPLAAHKPVHLAPTAPHLHQIKTLYQQQLL